MVVLCQNDAMAAGRVAADGHRQVLQLRIAQKLHGSEEAVQITVQNDAVHSGTSFFKFYHGPALRTTPFPKISITIKR